VPKIAPMAAFAGIATPPQKVYGSKRRPGVMIGRCK